MGTYTSKGYQSVLTKEEQDILSSVIDRTWQAIGSDLLVDEDGNIDYEATISRYDLAELCFDSDRWRYYCTNEKQVEDILNKLPKWNSYEWREEMKQVTTYEYYGY